MALNKNELANKIIQALNGIDEFNGFNGMNKMWETVCDYVNENADVTYSWSGTNAASGATETSIINASINTLPGNSLMLNDSFSQILEPGDVLSTLAGFMNAAASLWIISFPEDFSLASVPVPPALPGPCTVIPSISLSTSKKDNQQDAMEYFCGEIINGITGGSATLVATGMHNTGAFIGTATFTSIT